MAFLRQNKSLRSHAYGRGFFLRRAGIFYRAVADKKCKMNVSASRTYFNHFRRKYHNFPLSTVNFQFAR